MEMTFFKDKNQALEVQRQLLATSDLLKARMYPLSVIVPAKSVDTGNGTISETIELNSNGPFYMMGIASQFKLSLIHI